MMSAMLENVSTMANLIVLVFSAMYAVWSWLTNGFTRKIYDAVMEVPQIAEKQDEMCQTQQEIKQTQADHSRAIFLLVFSDRHDEIDIDEEELVADLETNGLEKYVVFGDADSGKVDMSSD
jgi:hypothetical protein